jgi:23S rRNA pseudouridine955/2504/2580 synthase/23S rRNA pseudouridine1911/1915/1917 synthase
MLNVNDIIIFEDDDLVVVNKPSGLLTIPDRYKPELPNLYNLLGSKYGKIFIVHRLDKETSGIVIFAKNAEVHRDLSIRFENGEVNKTYFAITYGIFREKEGEINLPIAPLKKKKGVMAVSRQEGKPSVTAYKVIGSVQGFTYVEVSPKSGRTHQIRVHLAAIGHPILNDVIYNRPEAIVCGATAAEQAGTTGMHINNDIEKSISRLALHAGQIRFFHLKKNEFIELEAPIEGDMAKAAGFFTL